jgi:hypothetical protein
MTQQFTSTDYEYPTLAEQSEADSSSKDVAKDQAAGVATSAGKAGQHVAGVAKDQAGNVAAEATRQAKDMVGKAREELTQQAASQQQRVAGGLRSLGTEFGSMADQSQESGIAGDLARQASTKAHDLADWLDQREPSSLLDEVKTFARRRPGVFLGAALGAGLIAGRLTRGLKDESTSSSSSTDTSSDYSPDYPSTGASISGYSSEFQNAPTPGYATGPVASVPVAEPVTGVQPVPGYLGEPEAVETIYPVGDIYRANEENRP